MKRSIWIFEYLYDGFLYKCWHTCVTQLQKMEASIMTAYKYQCQKNSHAPIDSISWSCLKVIILRENEEWFCCEAVMQIFFRCMSSESFQAPGDGLMVLFFLTYQTLRHIQLIPATRWLPCILPTLRLWNTNSVITHYLNELDYIGWF